MNARPALLQHNRPRTAERAPLRAWSCGIRRDDVGNEAERRPGAAEKVEVEHFNGMFPPIKSNFLGVYDCGSMG